MSCTACNEEPSYPQIGYAFAKSVEELNQRVMNLTNCCENNQLAIAPQNLSITGKYLTISEGNTVLLPNVIVSFNSTTNTLTVDGSPITLAGTNLSYTPSSTIGTLTPSTGTPVNLPLATSTFSGLFAPSEKNKLAFISITQAVDLDAIETNVGSLITFSGLAANSTNLGTFTGTTIPDNASVKGALQALETFAETKNVGIQWQSLGVSQGSTGTVNEFDVQGRVLALSRVGNKITLTGSTNSNNVRISSDISTNLSLLTDDILIITGTGLPSTVNLPAPENLRRFIIKNVSGYVVTVTAPSGLINGIGNPPMKIPTRSSEEFISNGATWFSLNREDGAFAADYYDFYTADTSALYATFNINGADFFTKTASKPVLSSSGYGFNSQATSLATTTVTDLSFYKVTQITKGAGSTINNQYGLEIPNLTEATNNYGIHSSVVSGTNKWNIYAVGTAKNLFNGEIQAKTLSLSTDILGQGNFGGGVTWNNLFIQVDTTNNVPVAISGTGAWSGAPVLTYYKSRTTTGNSFVTLIDGDGLGGETYSGDNGTTYHLAAQCIVKVDGTPAAGVVPARFEWYTSALGGTNTEKMRLTSTGTLAINTTTPHASALVQLDSTDKGFVPPRMTGAQVLAIASPIEGLMVYATSSSGAITAKGWWGWNGAAWEKLNN